MLIYIYIYVLHILILIFSCRYSNKNLSFGIVDLGHFPNAAEKFGISLGGNLCKGSSFLHAFFVVVTCGSIAQSFSYLGQLSERACMLGRM